MDLVGPYAQTTDCPLEKWFRDAKIYQLFEGTAEIQRMVISRMQAAEYRERLEGAKAAVESAERITAAAVADDASPVASAKSVPAGAGAGRGRPRPRPSGGRRPAPPPPLAPAGALLALCWELTPIAGSDPDAGPQRPRCAGDRAIERQPFPA